MFHENCVQRKGPLVLNGASTDRMARCPSPHNAFQELYIALGPQLLADTGETFIRKNDQPLTEWRRVVDGVPVPGRHSQHVNDVRLRQRHERTGQAGLLAAILRQRLTVGDGTICGPGLMRIVDVCNVQSVHLHADTMQRRSSN